MSVVVSTKAENPSLYQWIFNIVLKPHCSDCTISTQNGKAYSSFIGPLQSCVFETLPYLESLSDEERDGF